MLSIRLFREPLYIIVFILKRQLIFKPTYFLLEPFWNFSKIRSYLIRIENEYNLDYEWVMKNVYWMK